jgi:hypothetical protein
MASEGGGDAEACCRRLTETYRHWSARRHMQLREIAPGDGKGLPILAVTGFGAFRTLAAESGLHLLKDEGPREQARRTVARVTAVAGSTADLSAPGAFALASKLLAGNPMPSAIIRRYREQPAPLVRDLAGGWRSGRLQRLEVGQNLRPAARDRLDELQPHAIESRASDRHCTSLVRCAADRNPRGRIPRPGSRVPPHRRCRAATPVYPRPA